MKNSESRIMLRDDVCKMSRYLRWRKLRDKDDKDGLVEDKKPEEHGKLQTSLNS